MKTFSEFFARFASRRLAAPVLAALIVLSTGAAAHSQLLLANPHWNITLSDYGYSDFMLDNTPGFEGREYLSGEWAAAVAYQVSGGPAVTPKWLEPHFIFPDWNTGSPFHVVTPLTQTGLNADGLPIAQSVIANADIEITLRHEMIDTVVGTPMGMTPASSTGQVTFVKSDRYVLKQTCTVKNVSGAAISNLQFFQFLHGLNSQRGVFDNRLHPGPMSAFQHDMTLAGVDFWAAGPGASAGGLEDFVGFHASMAPAAFEIGHYGIEGNGVDDHWIGKPWDGVHLSVEANWAVPPFAAREGTDQFAPSKRWVAGAQRWDLGNLAAGQSASMDVILTLLTGVKVPTGTNSSGGCNGGSSVPGGVDYEFEDVTTEGSCFGEYSKADDSEIAVHIAAGEFTGLTFFTPGGPVQLWEMEFTGGFSGTVHLTFAYDPTILPTGFDESTLRIYQFVSGAWQKLPGTMSIVSNTISVATTSLSAFVLGVENLTIYNVSASASPTGSGTVTGGGTYAHGSMVTLVAVPNSGFIFTNWTQDGAVISSSPSCTFIASSNSTWLANFVPAGTGVIIATVALPANGGSTTGGGEYALGSSATVTAAPGAGYKFSKWREGDVTVSTSASYMFTAETNRTLVAKFKPVYTIAVTAEPEAAGEIEVDALYEFGDPAILKAVPFPGYCFVKWTQNGITVSSSPTYTFNVTGNRDLVGHFAWGNMINAIVEPASAGSVSGEGVYQTGTGVTLEAIPSPGYVFLRWTESNAPVSTSASYTFTCSTSRTLMANFTAQPVLISELTAPGVLMLSWPAGGTDWVLQECAALTGTWANSTRPEEIINGRKRVTITPLQGGGFFRLSYPQQ